MRIENCNHTNIFNYKFLCNSWTGLMHCPHAKKWRCAWQTWDQNLPSMSLPKNSPNMTNKNFGLVWTRTRRTNLNMYQMGMLWTMCRTNPISITRSLVHLYDRSATLDSLSRRANVDIWKDLSAPRRSSVTVDRPTAVLYPAMMISWNVPSMQGSRKFLE